MVAEKNIKQNGQGSAYGALLFVVVVWGVTPLFYKILYNDCSPLISAAVVSLISAIALLLLSIKQLKKLDKKYFLVAVPTGVFNSLASLLQKIGLQYTTPTQYAFLENLSCVVVPILMFVFIRKKPTTLKIVASVLCLVGAFVLSGMDFSSQSIAFGKGELLCALSGIFYGVNIAATGAFAKELFAPLYVMIQMWVQTLLAVLMAISFNVISVGGAVMEKLVWTWDVRAVLLIIGLALVVNTLCWVVRTNLMKKIDASVVATVMPFTAVVASVASVTLGMEMLTWNLCVGGALVMAAAILSGVGDALENRKRETTPSSTDVLNDERGAESDGE